MNDGPWTPQNPNGVEVVPMPAGGYIARTGHAADDTQVWVRGDTAEEARKKLRDLRAARTELRRS